jgi:hypothetical protein
LVTTAAAAPSTHCGSGRLDYANTVLTGDSKAVRVSARGTLDCGYPSDSAERWGLAVFDDQGHNGRINEDSLYRFKEVAPTPVSTEQVTSPGFGVCLMTFSMVRISCARVTLDRSGTVTLVDAPTTDPFFARKVESYVEPPTTKCASCW